ncbi:HAD-IA family hydrolase [Paenarthrobacter sp. C1]|uniref:HAD-IA family hydrolase n=1 Tax=Paenarthrobacter sp. C1 TaxID=3400220 RepID=UPI003BF4A84B
MSSPTANPTGKLAKLDALGLRDAFDVVVVCDGTRVRCKPHPDGFQAALDALAVPPARALMVGDRIDYDILPALELGMHAVRIRLGNHAGQEAAPAIVESDDPGVVWSHVLGRVATLPA